MDEGSDSSKPKENKRKERLLVVFSAVTVVAVMAIALIYASGFELHNSDDTSSDASEDELVSGVASDFMLNDSDIGADWNASSYNPDLTDNPEVTSASYFNFEQLNSSGDVHYRVEISIIVFDSVDNASAFYDKGIEIRTQDGSDLEPDHTSSNSIFLTNVSIGDKGGILYGPGLTPWNEVKWLLFLDKNVVCSIRYHDMTSYDPLPNELLIDLANKIETKIA
jgi:hypothetical protein